MRQGLVHVYTGDGKGKSTAAVGLAVRAIGGGLKVVYCTFHKDPARYGYTENKSLAQLGATVLNLVKRHPSPVDSVTPDEIREEMNEVFPDLKAKVLGMDADLLILDEILISVRDGYFEEEALLAFIKEKPAGLELVLTGRGATSAVCEVADYLTIMTHVKHPFDRGMLGRQGIEY